MAMSYAYSSESRKAPSNAGGDVGNMSGPGGEGRGGGGGVVGFREQQHAPTSASSRSTKQQSSYCGPITGERKKYFTQKYGQHQMLLIRKRLAVEEWLDSNLRRLYSVGPDDLYDCEIDMDEVLDFDTQDEQRRFIRDKLTNVSKPKQLIDEFIEQVLDKAESL